ESLTKTYAIPGLRLGYLIADGPIITRLRRLMPDWTVNTLAQRVGCRALADQEYRTESRNFVTLQRRSLVEALVKLPGLKVFPGD
ncbi:MAG: aminotransferase class I/II-fold pyridoxal phosphate-dependent enzyme, partial [Burkholderiales bacterium]|nr:aminotransferase class I/II-fold pyridoxal phosphate-dependent enzyme [Burkholderiales bacterium]